MKNLKVSIVIVCMNNLKNLYPCLDSIKKYTTISYETLVVAYLFSEENLKKLREDYSWIRIIESHEIRGFSENNNLALRQAKGEYCFVLNDDTYFDILAIDNLVNSIKSLPGNVAIVSPNILNPDSTVQFCGRPYYDWKTFIMPSFYEKKRTSKYINQSGTFESYNICGAAFLIKMDLFRKIGWFDEYYFFAPEDLALSTLLNNRGYKCYVNADVSITHIGGMSGKSLSYVQTATKPAHKKGSIYLFSNGNKLIYFLLSVYVFIITCVHFFFHRLQSMGKTKPNNEYILSICDKNTLQTVFKKITPKEIFIQYYNKL